MTQERSKGKPQRHLGTVAVSAMCALAVSGGAAYAFRAAQGSHASASRVPRPSLQDRPSKRTDLRWALFTFSDRQAGTYQCSLDGSRFTLCPRRLVYGLVEKTENAPLRRAHGKRSKRATHARPRTRRHRLHSHTFTRVCGQAPAKKARGSRRHAAHKPARCRRAYIEGVGQLLGYGEHTFRVKLVTSSRAQSRVTRYSWIIVTREELLHPHGLGSTGSTGGSGAGSGGAGTGGSGGAGGSGSGSTGSSGPTGSTGGGGSISPVVRTKSFVISGEPEGTLAPGGSALPIPLKLFNPNPVPIYVTEIKVSVASSPPGCPASENVTITQSSLSAFSPVTLPPGGNVTLPVAGASEPTIQFLNLPVNQNACQGANFPLLYYGNAHS
ncbi:MAG: hypothetical protein ACYDA6_03010 [Solirubrobacteraceae bacterium]